MFKKPIKTLFHTYCYQTFSNKKQSEIINIVSDRFLHHSAIQISIIRVTYRFANQPSHVLAEQIPQKAY